MIDDVVEIDPDAEAMGGFDHFDELIAGAVFRRRGAALIFVPEIEWVKEIIANGIDAAAFGRGRQPKAGVTGLGNRSEEHTSELQSPCNLVCRLLLEKKKKQQLLDYNHYYNCSHLSNILDARLAIAVSDVC